MTVARNARESVEVLILPDTRNAVLARESIEVLLLPTTRAARNARESVEVLMSNLPYPEVPAGPTGFVWGIQLS